MATKRIQKHHEELFGTSKGLVPELKELLYEQENNLTKIPLWLIQSK
jgi:hypothetical protein